MSLRSKKKKSDRDGGVLLTSTVTLTWASEEKPFTVQTFQSIVKCVCSDRKPDGQEWKRFIKRKR